MPRVIKEPYKFIEVRKDLTETDDEMKSGKLHVYGYKPTFLNTGTVILFINNRALKPGDQWHDAVPEHCPIDTEYDIVIGQDLVGQPDVAGLVAKPGTWVRVSYYLKVSEN